MTIFVKAGENLYDSARNMETVTFYVLRPK